MAVSERHQNNSTAFFAKKEKAAQVKSRYSILKVPAGKIGLSLLLPVLLLLSWEAGSRLQLFDSHLLPAPTVVLITLWSMAADGSLWQHTGATLYRMFWGFIWGTLIAVILGSITGMSKKVELMVDPLIQAFRSIPSLAWVPLFILWLGIGEVSKVTLIAVGVFFPVYLNVTGGIQSVDRKLIEVGKAYGLSTFQLIRRIVLPASLPSFFTGLRSGLGLGWMFVVAAELMGASQGLGFLLVLGQNTVRPEVILASILLFAVLGKITDSILKKLQDKALHWQDRMENNEAA